MARPKRNEHTRESLIEQGIEMLSEHGYHGTGLKQILDSVNVPKGSFYNYFKSKEQFTAEIISVYSKVLIDQFDAYLATTKDDPATIISTVYNSMIEHFEAQGCHKGCLIGNMAAEIGGTSEACRQSMQATLALWQKRFVGVIEKGQQEKVFRQDVSAEALADIFWNTWEGGILRMKIDGNALNLKKSLALLLDTLFR